MMTLELGRMSTWRLPRFSALTMLLRQSAFGGGDGVSFREADEGRGGEGRELTRTETRMATRSEGAS